MTIGAGFELYFFQLEPCVAVLGGNPNFDTGVIMGGGAVDHILSKLVMIGILHWETHLSGEPSVVAIGTAPLKALARKLLLSII